MGYVNSADLGNNGGSANNLSVAYTAAAGSSGLVLCIIGDTDVSTGGGHDDLTLVQYNSVDFTLGAKQPPSPSSNRYTYLYFLNKPTSGTNNIVINCTNVHWLLAGVAEYSGIDFSAVDAIASAIDGTIEATFTSSIGTIANNAWAFLVANNQGNGISTPTGGAGTTLRISGASFADWLIADSNGPITPAGTYSMTSTMGTNGATQAQIHVMASFPLLTTAVFSDCGAAVEPSLAARSGNERANTVWWS